MKSNQQIHLLSVSDRNKFINLKRVSIGYWNLILYSLYFPIILWNINKISFFNKKTNFKIFFSFLVSFEITFLTLKYFVSYFNNKEYSEFRKFCLKRDINDYLI